VSGWQGAALSNSREDEEKNVDKAERQRIPQCFMRETNDVFQEGGFLNKGTNDETYGAVKAGKESIFLS